MKGNWALITGDSSAFGIEFAKNLVVIRVGSGVHYLQEDHPQEIGLALRKLDDLEFSKPTEAAAD